MSEQYLQLADKLNIRMSKPDLYRLACIHRSYVNENKESEHNERLEFLGDAVLELVVTEHLYATFPQKAEGELTALRSALVRGDNLAIVARKLDLGQYLYLSHGEEVTGGRDKEYILANTVESLIGAIYLDQGMEITKTMIHEQIISELPRIIEQRLYIDSKSQLQELAQEKQQVTPSYLLQGESGPDHDKTFTMGVFLGKDKIAEGVGSSKQRAEEAAALAALEKMGWL